MSAAFAIDLTDAETYPSRRTEAWKYSDLKRWLREAPEPSSRLDMPRAAAPAAVQATPEGDVWLEVVQGLMAQEAITARSAQRALRLENEDPSI